MEKLVNVRLQNGTTSLQRFCFCLDGFKSVPTQGASEEQGCFSGAPSDVGLSAGFTHCTPPQSF